MARYEDLTGKRFGKLVVVRIFSRGRGIVWLCKCDCGGETTAKTGHLKAGSITSCKCVRQYHGASHTKLYKSWIAMKQRCYDQNCKAYQGYGSKGRTVCPEWRHNFLAFYNWAVFNGYEEGLTIDRIDNDGNYEPSNCQWITREENGGKADRKERLRVEYQGQKVTLKELSELTGLNFTTLKDRYREGHRMPELLNVRRWNSRVQVGDEQLSMDELSERFGVDVATLNWRYRKGWEMPRLVQKARKIKKHNEKKR